ncbi:Vacuolar protein sorting-associated protein like [Actinidia chinensis var. chinensis]|uniref:Vacuolar protein sorting-associated protein like n=1 Tax=Actinidia chinensis var. chinensis TaxID=1590841 RepID=A0A2R6Q4R4_ACTCC|nr:Vacuolar protein sorting-associated protein like [Actinidia chinensis var. chinensis]
MFEGLVRQLLLGYLGRYVRDIQKEQLKITLWNEEVLLENVELILEAFDYLQLPFALKQGRVGRLSIKIPWKKLGWDPIIITIEDVYISACQRDDQEWSMDAVGRREFAGKKAKLAAAELAKLSRRVCDTQAGQSFISYITAKILDGIQVSIRNVHIVYRNMLTDLAQTVFGIKFSSLTIMKQNLLGGMLRGGQVNKIVEIQGLEVYCSTFHRTLDLMKVDITGHSKLWSNASLEGNEGVHILAPVDVSMSLLVSRSGKHENDAPKYSVNVELTGLVLSLDEVQLQQILTLWDYLCICQLREKYGRYRPWNNSLSGKHKGWQIEWWHYAQQSVLFDVHERMKKTSWKHLGERLNRRRKYVSLYKTKLKCLREEQLIDGDILRELEQVEKESDIEDILNYRSTAESELQEFLLNSNSYLGVSGSSITLEKSHNDERSSSKSRGWLNWLSRGMLGAGGTDDSSQFSGVVSDEVIKDIYEATKFQPAPSPDGTAAADDNVLIDGDILRELEQVEKESDIEDILNYRSTAESELQEFLLNSNSYLGVSGSSITLEKSHNDERSSSKSRGWLNWLSRGMLGAGGTDDSSQFSGVVSDEVIKDIYEATKFQPAPSPDGTAAADDNVVFSEIKFHIHQLSATLWSMNFGPVIAELILEGMFIESKLWDESAIITILINSARLINPCNKQEILLMGRSVFEKELLGVEKTSASIQVDISSVNQDVKLLVKVQPLEVTYDSEFLLNVMEFCNLLEAFKFQYKRVMLSLNGIEDVRARLLTKIEYILSSRKRVVWDVNFVNVRINIPWRNANSEPYNMVLAMGDLFIVSKRASVSSDIEDQSYLLKNLTSFVSSSNISVEIQDLYNHLEIKVNDFEVKIIIPYHPQTISVLEKFSASISLTSCVIHDEPILKQLEVCIITPSLHANFSPTIYGAVLGLLANLDVLHFKSAILLKENSLSTVSSKLTTQKAFHSSIIANLESVSFRIDLENDKETNGCTLMFNLHKIDIRYDLMEMQECWISMKAMKVITYSLEGDKDSHILCSSENHFSFHDAQQQDVAVECQEREKFCGNSKSADGCFLLHYEEFRTSDKIFHKYTVGLTDLDLHCYPYIIRLLVEFSDEIIKYDTYHTVQNSSSHSTYGENPSPVKCFGFEKFGCSNFETSSSEWASIPLDCFPFITIYNYGSLTNLENSLVDTSPNWRNFLKLRDRSPKFCTRGSKMSSAQLFKSGSGEDAVVTAQNLGGSDVLIDLNLRKIKLHFHDCSCIVGTISLPLSKSSLSIRGDDLDILCSTEGLILCSSWCPQNICPHGFLWSPSLTNLSPILNVRFRKQKDGPVRSQFEISVSIQHVSCTLPPDFLAIIIGYFSLPDWYCKGNEQPTSENARRTDSEEDIVITYKFEVLDSTLFTPVESDDPRFLKLEIPQLYCSFIQNFCSNNVLKDIPPECLIAENKIARKNHCLNVFGRDLSLSLLLNSGVLDSSMTDQNFGCGYITFIAPFSADVWVRIPHESDSSCLSSLGSTCVMARVDNGQLIVKDQFSSVDRESKGFSSDVLHFLQFKKNIKENGAFKPEALTVTFTDVRCCVNSLAINLFHLRHDSISSELLARVDMRFLCSASFKNETLLGLDVSFLSLALFSQLNFVMLAECTSSGQVSSVLDINLSTSEQGENELHISLPALEIWLHLVDWTEVIDLLSSCLGQVTKTSITEVSQLNSMLGPVDIIQNVTVNVAESSPQTLSTSSLCSSHNMKQNAILLILKSGNIGIKIYVPVWISREAFSIFSEPQVQEERPLNDSCNIDDGGNEQPTSENARRTDSEEDIVITYKFEVLDSTLFTPVESDDPSADVWVRIPHESDSSCLSSLGSTCVMARVDNGQLIVKGEYIFVGFEALLDVIDQFSSVDRESKGFSSDVLHFLQFKKNIKENGAFKPEALTVTFTDVRCCVNSLAINLFHLRHDSISSELLARVDMRFLCSASFKNETLLGLDVSFLSLALFSQLNFVMLAECTSSGQVSSVLDINLSTSEQGENELHISLPALEIWLHLVDWTEVIDLLSSCLGQVTKTSITEVSQLNSMLGPVDIIQNVTVNVAESSPQTLSTSSLCSSHNMKQNAILLILKSGNIGIKIHVPVWISREAFSIFSEPQVQEERPLNDSCNIDDGVHNNFITISVCNRCSELVFTSSTVKINFNIDKISGRVGICEGKHSPSWPFLQFSQVNVEAEIFKNQLDLALVNADIQCNSLDLWFSYHMFSFWKSMRFTLPEAGSAQYTFSSDLNVKVKKISVLLTDGRWISKGPLLEILLRNLLLHANVAENKLEGSVAGDLLVNYNNINKVVWEPFVEPWKFQLSIIRVHEKSALLNSAIMTDIHITSTAQLNLNVTEALIEAVFRAIEMVKDAWGVMRHKGLSDCQRLSNQEICENMYTGRFAPYILQNLTSLPLVFHVCQGPIRADDIDVSVLKKGTFMRPGSSIPIYINDEETPEEQFLRCRPAHSSDRLSDQQLNGVEHHYIIIQFDGTCMLSTPISMDLVGLNYFEVDFSKSTNKIDTDNNEDVSKTNKHVDEVNRTDSNGGFVIPVACDVSVQRYCKLVRLYSTVILFNATSMPFEVRFDIPFGLSPKILDPIYPGQEFPLPLHLAEAGRVRWRPLGRNYLWSEAHNISNILSQESRIGLFRSFICYPSHPSTDPLRCCMSVQHVCFPSTSRPDKSSVIDINRTTKQSVEKSCYLDKSKKHFIHQITLSSPLVVRNYLPKALSLTIEIGGVTRTASLSEVETSFFHIDSSHDLGLVLHMHGFKPSALKFPRPETFCGVAKFNGTKFSLAETITFDPTLNDGTIYATVEKVMDAFSGAREICVFVPYLLYNCIGFPLIVSDCTKEMKGYGCIIPSCYNLGEQDILIGRKDGLGILSSSQDFHGAADHSLRNSSSKNRSLSTWRNIDSLSGKLLRKPIICGTSTVSHGRSDKHELHGQNNEENCLENRLSSRIQSNLDGSNLADIECRKVEACMYSPDPSSPVTEIMVRASRHLPDSVTKNMPKSSWSSPFFLVQPTGSTTVLVPQFHTDAAYVVSVTSSAIAGPYSGKTSAVTFQPRYVICNACSKDLCYKQKGTDSIFYLGIKQHSHLQWTDTKRELLVSIRFNEAGCQWSGCFLPDHLGDTQVKMWNNVSGAVNMIRVEVQNADIPVQDETIGGSLHGNSGTNMILLSDDDTGFMPYRIDNFSKERLRVYQQRCETFETVIQSYTSCPYAWDEPFYPHRLTVEVPGERIVGSYTLDEVKEYMPIYLPSTSEKPERTLLVSVHAEGAIKVLSIVDSSYHVLNDAKNPRVPQFKGKRKHDLKQEMSVDFKEKISVAIPFIGISLINSHPQELVFACAKNTRIDLLQSLDQQKFFFQVSSFQIDNQLPRTPYPVILSFDCEHRGNPLGQTRNQDDNTKTNGESLVQITSENLCEPVFCLAAAKWRNRDVSLVSFEYISLRMTDFHLELEQEVVLTLFDFIRTICSRSQVGVLTFTDSSLYPLTSDMGFLKESPSCTDDHKYGQLNGVLFHPTNQTRFSENCTSSLLLPSVVPIGAPWQQIFLLARRQKKIYVELLELAPIKLTLSFSSTPWTLRNGVLTSGESLIHRGLMAFADVEGAHIYLKQLFIAHHLASWESIQEIILRHYTRQLLHEMYKVFGSAGVIGNPMGFARSVSHGIKDFLSVPARSVFQSPAGLITGMAQGTTSLLSNTVFAISDAATQFSRAAHKGIVAFTFDDQAVAGVEKQQKGESSHSKGVVNEFLEGLTGLLQSPIKGAEKYGLPGVLSGVALGITGLVARPAASILEVTGKTAQSIRNRSKLHNMAAQRLRVRLPRPLSRELPLRPYSWEASSTTWQHSV